MPLMKPVPGSDAPRPIKSEQDEQRYTPTPRRIPLPVPEPGIFDEPTRCIKINKEWWSHISGMIDVLSSPELWLGTDDDKTRALRQVASLLAHQDCGGEMSCEDVEDCLDGSPTITEITNNVTENTTNITNITNDIEDIEDCGCGGNIYPPAPEDYENPNPAITDHSQLCGSAYYIQFELRNLALKTQQDQLTITFEEWLIVVLGLLSFNVVNLTPLWDFIMAATDPDLIDHMGVDGDKVAEAFFCNLLDRDAARAQIVSETGWSGEAQAGYLATLDAVTDGMLEKWAFIGSQVVGNDCSTFCNWVVVYDFDGNAPINPGDIVISGDSFEGTDSSFIAGVGYISTIGNMEIWKTLPPDCRLDNMVIQPRKHDNCGQLRWTYTNRGATGTDPQAQSPTQFTGGGEGITYSIDLNSAEMTEMRITTQNAICSGGGGVPEHIGYIILTGTGARPN